MGWIDREHIPAVEQDWRYGRLISLTKRLLEESVPKCPNCNGGWTTVRDADGNEVSVQCVGCGGTGEQPTYADHEENGQAGGGR